MQNFLLNVGGKVLPNVCMSVAHDSGCTCQHDIKSFAGALVLHFEYVYNMLDALPENHHDIGAELCSSKRLGRFSSHNRKPRPVLIRFPSIEDKHEFLQLSKQLRQSGLRLDDWLTEQQQKERDTLSADFQALKGKGYKPFFRGSVLMYCRNDKACVCQKDKADSVPLAA